MTNNIFIGIRNSIANTEPDAVITIHLHSSSYVSANINDISNCGDFIVVDTGNEDTAYIPIESIEFIQY